MAVAGDTLRRAREQAGLSQRALARRAGTSQAAVSRIESGLEEPTFARFEQLMAGLGLRPTLAVEPLAEHEAEPRRLIEQHRKTDQERFEEALSWARFVRRLEAAGRRALRG